jgi:hypothetical protein
MPKPPPWVWEALRDIFDAMCPAPSIALPWIGSVLLLVPLLNQPVYVFV